MCLRDKELKVVIARLSHNMTYIFLVSHILQFQQNMKNSENIPHTVLGTVR